MIITLAGHVDHGKTTLVRTLTGTDTDRLAEEKRRGLTIDLGFAYLETERTRIGFVDVPGHHRFVHNMVAGVAATQHALLVVAADDGPMPQTREHLQILDLLGISGGVVALTKCDAVSVERIAEVTHDVRRLVSGSFLARAPIVETSTVSGQGLAELRTRLLEAAALPRPESAHRPFRLPIDRAFTLKGSGLVVTGTVHAGQVALDDEVNVFPLGMTARVRDLRVQNRPADRAVIGDRAAINLAGPDHSALARGHWLCARPEPGHRNLVVHLAMLADFPRDVRHFSPVHVYHATSHSTGRLALLEGTRLRPGERALVELVLDQPLLAKRGDRVVIRDHGREHTMGGGAVIDNRLWPDRRRSPLRRLAVEACAQKTPRESLQALLAQGPVELAGFRTLWDVSANELTELLEVPQIRSHEGWLVAEPTWRHWAALLQTECEARHRDDPTLQGLRENDFTCAVPRRFRTRLLNDLAASNVLTQRAGRFRPRSHAAALSAAESRLLERLRPLLDHRQPPSLGDIGRSLRIPLDELKTGIKALASKGVVVRVGDKRAYLPRHLDSLADIAAELSSRGPFTARDYRDAAGIGRNVAIDVLEHFDGSGFTRRQGDTRFVVSAASNQRGTVG